MGKGIKPPPAGEGKPRLNRCAKPRASLGFPPGGPRMTETRLSFKEMCATFDVTPRTLR
jgi:hypothetical protein